MDLVVTNPVLRSLAEHIAACERHWSVEISYDGDSVCITKPDVPGGWDFKACVRRSGRISWRLFWCDDEIVTGSAFDVDGVMRDLSEPY